MQYPYQIDSAEAYQKSLAKSVEEPEQFWSDIAGEFVWKKQWDKVLDWNFREPKISWFAGGRLNITENCLDRHLEEQGDQPQSSGSRMILQNIIGSRPTGNCIIRSISLLTYCSTMVCSVATVSVSIWEWCRACHCRAGMCPG